MAIRIKITPLPDDVAEMRKQLAKQLCVDAEKLNFFDEFFSEFEAKLAMVDFNNTKYGLYDAADFNLFSDAVTQKKQLMDRQLDTQHHLVPANYMTLEYDLVSEDHNKIILDCFRIEKNSDE
jgi:hypothetical protein